jgi:hypothetical protein
VGGWVVAQRGRGAYKGAGGGRTASGRVSDRGAALGVGGCRRWWHGAGGVPCCPAMTGR